MAVAVRLSMRRDATLRRHLARNLAEVRRLGGPNGPKVTISRGKARILFAFCGRGPIAFVV
jgi:hypothetical protein